MDDIELNALGEDLEVIAEQTRVENDFEDKKLRDILEGLTNAVLAYHATASFAKKEKLEEVIYWLGQSQVVLNPTRDS